MGGGDWVCRCPDDESDTRRPGLCLSTAKSCERGSAAGLFAEVIVPASRSVVSKSNRAIIETHYRIQALILVAPDEWCPMMSQMRQAHPSSSQHLLAYSAAYLWPEAMKRISIVMRAPL